MRKPYFSSTDIALTSIFCALWAVLNLALGPLSFRLLGLPILHDFAAFFTLLLVTWLTSKFGIASLVGSIGSVIVLLIGAPPPVIGFAAMAILFDALMSVNHHTLDLKTRSIILVAAATAASAYFAGVMIGTFFMNKPLDWMTIRWALTIWGGWHLIGGIISMVITLPVIGVLEKAKVRKISNAH